MADGIGSITLTGSREEIIRAVGEKNQAALWALEKSAELVPFIKGRILDFQAVALWLLASQFDKEGARILEIGTKHGFSASIMAQAAPQAQIVTLNPDLQEFMDAKARLAQFPNVRPLNAVSWEYYDQRPDDQWDMIFVDGNHKLIIMDMPWLNRLKVGGLILFHDVSPADSTIPCIPVYLTLRAARKVLRREPDVQIVDTEKVGMEGYYRKAKDVWPT